MYSPRQLRPKSSPSLAYQFKMLLLAPVSDWPDVFKLTKSNAATFGLPVNFSRDPDCLEYLPITRLFFTIRQVICSGFFCDVGVKNDAIDFSETATMSYFLSRATHPQRITYLSPLARPSV